MVNLVHGFVSTVGNLTGESAAKDLVEFLKRWLDEVADKLSLADIERAMSSLQLPRYTLGHIALLLVNVEKVKSDEDFLEFLQRVADSLPVFNDRQIQWAPDIYSRLFQNIADALVARDMPIRGIRLLRDAILKLTNGSTMQLTNIQASLFYLCLKSRHFKESLPFFKLDVADMFLSGSSSACGGSATNEKENVANGCSSTSSPPKPASPQNYGLDSRSVLLYFYYGGMILCALERHREAVLMFEHAICLPAVRLSAIMLESFKKYVLVSLILGQFNPTAQLPAYKSAIVKRLIFPLCKAYTCLAQLIQKGVNAKMDVASIAAVYLEEKRDVFEKDQNVGLMKQLIAVSKERAIKRLGNVFVSLDLAEVSRLSFTMNKQEAEDISRRLCYRDQHSVQYDQKTQIYRFDVPASETKGKQGHALSNNREVDAALGEMMELSRLIRSFDDTARLNPTYVNKQYRMRDHAASQGNGFFLEDEGFPPFSALSSSPPYA